EVRGVAVAALGQSRVQSQAVMQRLILALSDSDATVREAAVNALLGTGSALHSLVPQLAQLLQSEDRAVSRSAAYVLGHVGPAASDAVPALIAAMRMRSDSAADSTDSAYADSLRRIGSAAVPALVAAMKDMTIESSLVVDALGGIGPQAIPDLINT